MECEIRLTNTPLLKKCPTIQQNYTLILLIQMKNLRMFFGTFLKMNIILVVDSFSVITAISHVLFENSKKKAIYFYYDH